MVLYTEKFDFNHFSAYFFTIYMQRAISQYAEKISKYAIDRLIEDQPI